MELTPILKRHTLSAFDADLSDLSAMLSKMADLSVEAMKRSLAALGARDPELARSVCDGDVEIDRLQARVETLVVRTIALRAPMADDLRSVVAALKIASLLERVGDYAKNIARRASLLGEADLRGQMALVSEMGAIAGDMVAQAADAFARSDIDAASAVCDRDRRVDDLYDELVQQLVAAMTEDPSVIGPGTHLLFAGKQIERAGDHATNIAEAVYYAVTGGSLPERRRGGVGEVVPLPA